MKHNVEIFRIIRTRVLPTFIIFVLAALLIGTAGCSGGTGERNDERKDTSGCLDIDRDDYYAGEGCGGTIDCNDRDATVYPGAVEQCVDIDNDCDGLVDEDCLAEICNDGLDNDGDGVIDEDCHQGTSFVTDTGQTRCYGTRAVIYPCPAPGEDFYGQDACFPFNFLSYTKLDAGGGELPEEAPSWAMVRDNVTGLIWEVKTDDGSVNDMNNILDWEGAANDYINWLNTNHYCGYTDWRLPNIEELTSIVNFNKYDPALNRTYFPNTKSDLYWSSTTNEKGLAKVMDFFDGGFVAEDKRTSCYVRAVRGAGTTVSYHDNGDGTVTASFNGKRLMWAQESTAEVKNWEEALNYCEELTLAGYSDWRMPNVKELRTLVDHWQSQPAIDNAYFPDTPSGIYWSSTTYVRDSDAAWAVSFINGNSMGGNDKTYDYHRCYTRAVRGGE